MSISTRQIINAGFTDGKSSSGSSIISPDNHSTRKHHLSTSPSNPLLPFESPLNHVPVRIIAECLKHTSNNPQWVRHPRILLWILLNVASAALYLPERSVFVLYLIKVGTSAAWCGTEEAKAARVEIRAGETKMEQGWIYYVGSVTPTSLKGVKESFRAALV